MVPLKKHNFSPLSLSSDLYTYIYLLYNDKILRIYAFCENLVVKSSVSKPIELTRCLMPI